MDKERLLEELKPVIFGRLKKFDRLNKDYDIDKEYYLNKMADEILLEIKIRL